MKKPFILLSFLLVFMLLGCDFLFTESSLTIAFEYTVSYESNGGTEFDSQDLTNGSLISVPTPLKEGFTFLGWFYDEELITPFSPSTTLQSDITLYAKWNLNAYTISFETFDGTVMNEMIKLYGSSLPMIENPVKDNFTFSGWYLDSDYTMAFDFTMMPSRNITLYAKWENSIIFDTNGGSFINSITQESGAVVFQPDNPTKDGYTFIGWYSDQNFINEFTFDSMPSTNITLYAKWQINQYIIGFESNGGNEIDNIIQDYDTGIIRPIPVKTGYTFMGWFRDEGLSQEFLLDKMPSTNVILYAKWEVNQYTISFVTNGGSEILPIIQDFNSTIQQPLDPTKLGYSVEGWYTDEELTQKYVFSTMPSENISLYAKWELAIYQIYFDTQGGEQIAPLPITSTFMVNELPMPSKLDYTFDGWMINEEIISAPFTYDFLQDITLVAKWRTYTNGISYEIVNEEAIITEYLGNATELKLPDNLAGYPVVEIKAGVFENNNTLTSIIVGNYVVIIGDYTFSNMANLLYLEFPNSTKDIGSHILYLSNTVDMIVISSELPYELKYYFGNDIAFIPNSLKTVKYAASALYIDKTLTQNEMKNIQLKLADDLNIIPASQFNNSLYLTSIYIPANVTEIGDSAFSGTTSLSCVTFEQGSNLDRIESNAFRKSNITSIIIPANVSYIGDAVFQETFSLVSIVFEENSQLIFIGNNSFFFARSLTNIDIPFGVTEIGNQAFYYAESLKQINIPNTVTTIGGYAFYFAGSLETIHIPASVTSIGSNAFNNARMLNEITFDEDSQLTSIGENAFFGAESLITIHIPSTVTSIGEKAFYATKSLTSVYIPENVATIGPEAFGEAVLSTIFVSSRNQPIGWNLNWNPLDRSVIWGYSETIDDGVLKYALSIDSKISILGISSEAGTGIDLLIPACINENIVIQIVNNAFMNEDRLNSIQIPNTITSIPVNTFKNAINLSSITFEENSQLSNINEGSFYGTNSLTSIRIPSGVTNIGDYAFYGNRSLSSIVFEDGSELLNIGSYAFYELTSLMSFYLPSSVKNIGSFAFYHNMWLNIFSIEESSELNSIGSYAFYGNSSLVSIYLPISVSYIGAEVFSYANTTIYAEATEQPIGWNNQWNPLNRPVYWQVGTYSEYNDFSYAVIGNSEVVIIGRSVNSSSNNLVIPSLINDIPVTIIQDYAFSSDKFINSIFIPSSITMIGSDSFLATTLTEVIFEEGSQLSYIGKGAFQSSIYLQSIIVPSNVIYIGAYAFYQTNSLLIYSATTSLPEGWDLKWNYSNRPVYWSSDWHYDFNGDPTPNL